MGLLDWIFDSDDSDSGPDSTGEYGIWDDYPENMPADNDYGDD